MESFENPGEEVEWFYEVFDPQDFEISPIEMHWRPPASIALCVVMRPTSDEAIKRLMLSRKLEFVFDAFARHSPRDQFYTKYWETIDELREIAPRWSTYLHHRFPDFERVISDTSQLLAPPFRMVQKSDFTKATLAEILREDPELVDVYVAEDWNSEGGKVAVLRMHSVVWHSAPGKKYLWFEKKVPWTLYPEDILVWYRSLLRRLPKKDRPPENFPWLQRLVNYHCDFAPDYCEPGREWTERPRIALVFGEIDQIGSAAIFHLERSDIHSFLRTKSEITIRANLRCRDHSEDWVFRVFAQNEEAAESLEEQFMSGRFMHFGVGSEIRGLMGQYADRIEAIGISNEEIRRHGDRDGFFLGSYWDPRLKHKHFNYHPLDYPREGMTYSL